MRLIPFIIVLIITSCNVDPTIKEPVSATSTPVIKAKLQHEMSRNSDIGTLLVDSETGCEYWYFQGVMTPRYELHKGSGLDANIKGCFPR